MLITRETFLGCLEKTRKVYHQNYLAMYSSVFGGIVTDPLLMMAPLDDHLVHRGDGVFETIKCVDGGVYNFSAHLERLQFSASTISLTLPQSPAMLTQTVLETIKAAGVRDCAVRVLVSRGPGSFGVNPYDSPVSALYVVVTKLSPSFMDLHPGGATVKTSSVPIKPSFFATMKNCNYLPNVLMKKEAVDAGFDFAVTFDDAGYLAEGATENIGIVNQAGALLIPTLANVLCGTTMVRVMELAQSLVAEGILQRVEYSNITYTDMRNACEILIFGTTTDVTRVCRFDDMDMGGPGAVFKALSPLLLADIRTGKAHRTLIDEA